jgi:hypothetical protein
LWFDAAPRVLRQKKIEITRTFYLEQRYVLEKSLSTRCGFLRLNAVARSEDSPQLNLKERREK